VVAHQIFNNNTVLAASDGHLYLVTPTGEVHDFDGHRNTRVSALALDARRSILYSAAIDGSIIAWKVRFANASSIKLESRGTMCCPSGFASRLEFYCGVLLAVHGDTTTCWIAKVT
jgi:hypothetical protein